MNAKKTFVLAKEGRNFWEQESFSGSEFTVIDLHAHILPGLDDGPQDWEEALAMARAAAADGLTGMVATPHLFEHRGVYQGEMNRPERILPVVREYGERLAEAGIDLEIYPGCEAPLFVELPKFLAATTSSAHYL